MKLLLLYKQIFSDEIDVFDQEKSTYYKQSEKEQRPSSIGVQGDSIARGLTEIGVETCVADLRDDAGKTALYRNFKPNFVVGVGFWGDTPELVEHPQKFGQTPVPWLVADGAVLNYQEKINRLRLIMATSKYCREVLIRDGINQKIVKVVYEGIDTNIFKPLPKENEAVKNYRDRFRVGSDEFFFYTLGGDAQSKGVPEILQALHIFNKKFTSWKYAVKISLNETSKNQMEESNSLVRKLGLEDKVEVFSELLNEKEMAYLMNAADVYLAPSRNESFGRPHVEAQSCGVPVLSVDATATREVVRHGVTGFNAKVLKEIYKKEFQVGEREGYSGRREVVFKEPKLVEVRADPNDLAHYLSILMDKNLREKMGAEGRKFVLDNFDYRVSARKMVEAIEETYGKKS